MTSRPPSVNRSKMPVGCHVLATDPVKPWSNSTGFDMAGSLAER